MKDNQEKIESTVFALQEFIQEFGSQDDYTKLVMEIILEELFEKKQDKK